MNLKTALTLGRVSNLPTVWSNVLAGMILAGAGTPGIVTAILVLLSMSLMYVGGMYLNDAFDAEIDKAQAANRPIPNGEVSRKTVFTAGFAMLGTGLLLLIPLGLFAFLSGLGLAGAVLLYDWHHKNNPLSPLVMGVCRMLVYAVAGFALTHAPAALLFWGALALLGYLIGLTYIAKQENLNEIGNLWPLVFLASPFVLALVYLQSLPVVIMLGLFAAWVVYALTFLFGTERIVPKAVVSLIAGISLLDACLILLMDAIWPAALAIACFALTLWAQRSIRGT